MIQTFLLTLVNESNAIIINIIVSYSTLPDADHDLRAEIMTHKLWFRELYSLMDIQIIYDDDSLVT